MIRARLSLFSFVALIMLVAVNTAAAQTFTVLYEFGAINDPILPSYEGIIAQGLDGNLYTTSPSVNSSANSAAFKITPSGGLTVLNYFTQGNITESGLTLGTDGNFYGTTAQAVSDAGEIFKMTPSGGVSVLHTFANGQDGGAPKSPPVEGTDGNFYGTTNTGGANGWGTVYQVTSSGGFKTIYSFVSFADGADPWAPLVQGADGSFYAATFEGGSSGQGVFFKITTSGQFTSITNFSGIGGVIGPLVQAGDGNFYGTSSLGGSAALGTVFKITPGGAVTVLHNFTGTPDGSTPNAGLVLANDGNFYGVTSAGGNSTNCQSGCGTIFQMTPAGKVTILHNFDHLGGFLPNVTLLQHTNGIFYGDTVEGGTSTTCTAGCGVFFSLNTGLSPFIKTLPSFGNVGAPITILGSNLSGATSVQFNGTPATFNVVSASEITTTVPAGATTGTVEVTVGGNTVITNTDFQVTGPIQFVPVTPCRMVDTRGGNPIQGGTSQNFIIPQLGGCGIPASAAAYSLNVTVIPHGALGYLTIWPEGEIQPYVSTMNSPDGRIKANAAIVPSGNNAVSVYASDTTNVILDIDGYFVTPGSQTYQFYPLTPCRLVDTRNGNGGPLQAGVERDYTIAGHCGIPSTATAYSFNVTVLPTNGELDYLTVWPKGETQPVVSTLNDPTGTVVANAAVVPAGAHNATAFYAHDNPTNLLLDVNGYFAPVGSGGLSLYPVAPCRVLDTRGNGGPFMGDWNPPNGIDVLTSSCAPPSTSKAFVFNATVVPSGVMPYLTLWPHGQSQPNVSTLNAYDGSITSNMALVPTTDGSVDAYAAGLTQLLLDISGYFAP